MTGICGEENVEAYSDNKYIVHFPFLDGDFGYNLLLGFGDKCECLEPESVRSEIAKRIKNLWDIYNR